jgi:hypothetical protein
MPKYRQFKRPDGRTIYINPDLVTDLAPVDGNPGETEITFSGRGTIVVAETFERVYDATKTDG